MGNDSRAGGDVDKPRMIYDYFKQLFAQVTNPAIDSIREEVIMSLECYIGPERNLLETTEEHAAPACCIPHPILTNEELAALQAHRLPRLARAKRASTSPIAAIGSKAPAGLERQRHGRASAAEAEASHRRRASALIVLSDRAISAGPRARQRAAGGGRGPSSPGQAG